MKWPEQKWLGWVFIGAGAALAFGLIVWWLAQRAVLKELQEETRRSPIGGHPALRPSGQRQVQHAPIQNNPVFNFAPTLNQTQGQRQAVARQVRDTPPVFEPTRNARIVRYGLDLITNQLIREPYYGEEKDLPEDKTLVDVALAQFFYKPDVGVEPFLYVSAHVFLHDADYNVLRPAIYNAIWNDEDFSRTQDFYAGRAHDLIVALIPSENPIGIFLYEHEIKSVGTDYFTNQVVMPNLHPIRGESFVAQVELIPKRVNDPLPTQTFWFKLSLMPKPDIVAIEAPVRTDAT